MIVLEHTRTHTVVTLVSLHVNSYCLIEQDTWPKSSFPSSVNASFWLDAMLHSEWCQRWNPSWGQGVGVSLGGLAWATDGVSKDKWNWVSPHCFLCSEQYGCNLYEYRVLSDQLQWHNFMGGGGSMLWRESTYHSATSKAKVISLLPLF